MEVVMARNVGRRGPASQQVRAMPRAGCWATSAQELAMVVVLAATVLFELAGEAVCWLRRPGGGAGAGRDAGRSVCGAAQP